MKIVRNDSKGTIKFADVECGEIFEFDGDFYIKICDDIGEYWGICLADGKVRVRFGADYIVIRHKTALHILD